MNRIVRGDVLSFARHWEGDRFHALLCDPPYEYGFMGKKWDGTGIAFRPETWEAFSDLLYPGAFGMAFASSRGWHRLAVAIEDAGYIIHPSIFIWTFGSGFPKATRIDTQIDKAAGADKVLVPRKLSSRSPYRSDGTRSVAGNNDWITVKAFGSNMTTEPVTDLAKAFSGHRYGLQALKPAAEPIIVFQKPYEGKPIESITKYGSGSLNVDGGRIGTNDKLIAGGSLVTNSGDDRTGAALGMFQSNTPNTFEQNPNGRRPANFALSHSPDCDESDEGIWDCDPSCPVRLLGEQSGESKSNNTEGILRFGRSGGIMGKVGGLRDGRPEGHSDTGTAARFFFNSDWNLETEERLATSDPVLYQAKASRSERDAGLDLIEAKQRDLSRNISQPSMNGGEGNPYNRGVQPVRNSHPTVKPIALNKWLATLLLPPSTYSPRRIFVPFAGVASEMIGCMQAGWEEVIGAEGEKEYTEIGRARLKFWSGYTPPDKSKPKSKKKSKTAKPAKTRPGEVQLALPLK